MEGPYKSLHNYKGVIQMEKKSLKAVPFLLPAFLIYFTIIVIPAVYSLYLSFFTWNGVSPNKIFVGLSNYINIIFNDPVFGIALRNNITWMVLALVITNGLALSLAILLNRQFIGRTVFRGIFYFPYILSGIVAALMWSWIYHPQLGFLNSFLSSVGLTSLQKGWLSDTNIAFFAVYAASLWQYVGAPMVLYLAGLQTIPRDLYESAYIDGVNAFQSFIYITVPMLKETFVIVVATLLINAMKIFDIIFALTGGGPANKTQTLATWMYNQTYNFANIGIGTAISWILVIVVMSITVPYVIYMSRE